MKNVDPIIISSLYDTDTEFFKSNNIDEKLVKKYFYKGEIIEKLQTPKLEKYKDIKNLNIKINNFLTQDIIYTWELDILKKIKK